jgi:hypothetical protein
LRAASSTSLAACVGLFLVPVFAQAQAAAQTIADSLPPASSAVSSSVLDLPDAPVPPGSQNTQPQSQTPAQSQTQGQPQSPNSKPQQPPPSTAPTLGDLGFSQQQTLANAEMQKKLNERTHDLKVHQTLGLITAGPMCAAVIVAGGAKAKRNKADPTGPLIEPSSASVDLHAALGASTVALYSFTAYYAIRAPRIPGVKPKGAIKLHRDLVWIHAPGMILTPILGGIALSQENNGERVHGIASAHSYVAWTTIGAYGASIMAVSWPLHIKF